MSLRRALHAVPFVLFACDGPAEPEPGLRLVTGDSGYSGAPSTEAGPDVGAGAAPGCGALDATVETIICDCTLAGAEDHSAASAVTVKFTNKYLPRCLLVKAGTTVTWTGNFYAHPLWPSACAGDVAKNPIHDVSDPAATSLAIAFPEPGFFPYLCPDHASDTPSPGGMCGVVYVVP